MARGSHTEEDRERVLAMYAVGMTGREIARQLDISESTVRLWIKQARQPAQPAQKDSAQNCAQKTDDLDKRRFEKRIEFIENAWAIVGKTMKLVDRRITRALEHETELDELLEAVEDIEINSPRRQALLSKINSLQIQSVRELSTLIGTIYDKAALASGDATANANVNVNGMSDEDRALLDDARRTYAAGS